MSFYPEKLTVPTHLITEDFIARPLRVADAEKDYEAVISSRAMLHIWDQSDWPDETFTLEDNRDDLEEHETAHNERRSFTYTILNNSESLCLGCIYISPLKPVLKSVGATDHLVMKYNDLDVYVTFWVRESEIGKKLEEKVLSALLTWLNDDWSFPNIVLGSNSQDTRQSTLFVKHGFKKLWEFPVQGKTSFYSFYQQSETI